MERSELLKTIESSKLLRIGFAIVDIDGVLRGKIISKNKLLKCLEDNIGFCNVVFGWDMNDAPYDNTKLSGWHTGYPDGRATIDLNTFRQIPWDDKMPFFLGDFSQDPTLSPICPRTLLKKIRQECIDLGFQPQFGAEYEWFTFQETPDTLAEKNHSKPTPLTPGMFGYSVIRASQNQQYFNALFDLLHAFRIPVEGLHTETGDGVYEGAIEYSDVLQAADHAALFKTSVKEIAGKHNLLASFMAKWNDDLPGCSGHIHQSLWDTGKQSNLFADTKNPEKMSDLMRHYIAGQLHCLPYILPLYAPTVNSYKRLVEGSWAAVSASWGIENRTTALRIINNSMNSVRIETRVPGADANPYLAMSACLASGLYGIKNRLSLDVAPTKGNEYENESQIPLPRSLEKATNAMKSSPIPKELFGATFVDHFIKTREWEWNQFSKKVTDWELKRYFEVI